MAAASVSHARILGVDPGMHGALALWDTRDGSLVVRDMPVAEGQVSPALLMWELHELAPVEIVFIEAVHSMPKQGVASTFKFGVGYGAALGTLASLEVPVFRVTPGVWKRALKLPADKDAARGRAATLFPKHRGLFARVRDDGRAEAALIAFYGNTTMSVLDTGHNKTQGQDTRDTPPRT